LNPHLHIRDIHQLRNAPPFGPTAIEGLLTVESMLTEVLRFVPYCDEHKQVWSYHLARIILDASSQLDSLWKAAAVLQDPGAASDRLTIIDHFNRNRDLLSRQQVVFFAGSNPCTLWPFSSWQSAEYISPPWWTAYNNLKHDRLANQTDATLENAANAVGALLLGIVYCGACDVAIVSAELVSTTDHNLWAYTESGLIRDVHFEARATVETRLFAHPLGVFGAVVCNLSPHWGGRSPRFNFWWALNSSNYTRPLPPQHPRGG
jgi:hypothetical protein